MPPIVHQFFAEVDDPLVLSEKCPESNMNHVYVVKNAFRVNGLKRGTRKRKEETDRQYRARRAFSDMISAGLRFLGQNDGEVDEFVLSIVISIEAERINSELGRAVSRKRHWRECEKAAREARRMWHPETARKIKATASKAGSVTKWTLEDYLETREMKPSQALRYLREKKGIKSRTTVLAMRKYYGGLNTATGEVT